MSTILECKNLSKKYGRKLALDGINLSLNSGRIMLQQKVNFSSMAMHPV